MNLQELGILPISQETPAGNDIRYEPAFEDLQAEIDRMSSPTAATESIDWRKIANLAADILSGRSKDLLVASYFCVAQIHLAGIEGMELGLKVFADLLENFWTTLFPLMKRMRGRIAAIEWCIEKCESTVTRMQPESLDATLKDRICAEIDRIDRFLADNLPDAPLSLHSISRLLEMIPSDATPAPPADTPAEPEPEASPEPEPPPQPKAQPEPAPSETPRHQPERETDDSLEAQLLRLQNTSASLLEDDLSNPLPYRLLRFSIWSALHELPSIASDDITLIPPPDPQTVMILRELFDKGDWMTMIGAAEYQLSQYVFWLDLNRFSAISLETLGPHYRKAAECVTGETGFFLSRLPGLINLKFSDGTPFADQATIDWLQSIAATASASSDPVPTGDAGDPLARRMDEVAQTAQTLLQERNLPEAVGLYQQEIRHCFSVKERTLWRLGLCRVLAQAKSTDLAIPHYDLVLEDIRAFRVEEWDPAFALHCLKSVWSGLQKISDRAVREKAASVLDRIAGIDPLEALKIKK